MTSILNRKPMNPPASNSSVIIPVGDNPFACQQTYSGNQEYRCCMSADLSDNL